MFLYLALAVVFKSSFACPPPFNGTGREKKPMADESSCEGRFYVAALCKRPPTPKGECPAAKCARLP